MYFVKGGCAENIYEKLEEFIKEHEDYSKLIGLRLQILSSLSKENILNFLRL